MIIAKSKLNKFDYLEIYKNGIFKIKKDWRDRYEIRISFIKDDKKVDIQFIIPKYYKKCFPFLNMREFTPGTIFNDDIISGLYSRWFIIYKDRIPIFNKYSCMQHKLALRQTKATFSFLGYIILKELNSFIVNERLNK